MQPIVKERDEADELEPWPMYEPVSAEFEQLIQRVLTSTANEKWFLLYRLLRDLIPDGLNRQVGVFHPDRSSFVFIIPPVMSGQLDLTPEVEAEIDESMKTPTEGKTLREIMARLHALEAQEAQEAK
jgi:hypothetical protein